MSDFEKQFLICRSCKVPVNRFWDDLDDDSSAVWIHAQTWKTYDHEPDPVVVARGTGVMVCDFCGRTEVKWSYVGASDVRVRRGSSHLDLGRKWAACDGCDKILRRADWTALRAWRAASPAFMADYAGSKAQLQRDWAEEFTEERFEQAWAAAEEGNIEIIQQYLSTRPRRSLFPPPPPPPPALTPQRLPKVRDRLARMWLERMPTAISGSRGDDPILLPGVDVGHEELFVALTGYIAAPAAQPFCERVHNGLLAGEMYWVSKEFTTLAVIAGRKLPDLTVTREEMPSPSGLVVWQDPIMEVQVRELTQLVIAASWTLVPDGVWITLYAQPEQLWPDQNRERLREALGWLVATAPGAGLQFGRTVDWSPQQTEIGATAAWGTLLSTWFLMAQPGVATQTPEASTDKGLRRSYARAGRPAPAVRVVDVRWQKSRAPVTVEGGERTFQYSVRFMVGADTGGFWREQPYGPQRSLRKRLWIFPFMKGPDGAPLKDDGAATPVVRVLR